MRKRNFAVAAMAALALSGCATGYRSINTPLLGFSGGYWEQRGPGQLIKVGFSGNGFIDAATVSDYLLYRCAEVAQREGSTHFVLYTNLPAAISDRRSSDRHVFTTFGKPDGHAYILLVPADAPSALSVQEVLDRLGPKVKPQTKPGTPASPERAA